MFNKLLENGDSKVDLIMGLEDGTLAYFENTSTGPSPSFAAPIINYKDNNNIVIQNGLYAAPQLFDLNKDGLLDLIIGIKTGELIYYENSGTATNPEFTLVTTLLGGIDVSELTPDGYSVPCFFNSNDTTYAMIGCVDGSIKFIGDIDGYFTPDLSFENVLAH